MNTPLRTIVLGQTRQPTHRICRPVAALRIVATDEIGSHRRVTALLDGEAVHVALPADFCRAGTPVSGDYVVIEPDGALSHRPGALFEVEAVALPRANAGFLPERPRVPRIQE